MVLTAITNTNALVNPATPRSTAHSNVFVDKGIAARLAAITGRLTRHAVIERASRGQIEPASAPAR
ncbi:hypothetical protein BN970_02734 [Mycolicibacterium conceptionense]|uniref:Uncharacterized protein n=1 Tax=Mycolicibacterium conceptionense TaxID=451644 RepID=A0A0U1DE19_9MYCO|nr:hypothetical protein BN970_02734 [Mycolicibacterium conceptionense]